MASETEKLAAPTVLNGADHAEPPEGNEVDQSVTALSAEAETSAEPQSVGQLDTAGPAIEVPPPAGPAAEVPPSAPDTAETGAVPSLSADEQSKTGSTSPPAAKAVTNGPAADLECSTATATKTNVAALGLPDEIWPEALGPECYKLVLDLLALTDPNSTSEPRIVEIMNGKYEGAPTTSVSDDDRRLCKEEYERIKCSVADAIRFLHSRQKQIPEASRHLARQIMWRSNRNKALALRRKQLLARDTDMTPEIASSKALWCHIPLELMEEGCFKAVGRDRCGRPILCVSARMWSPGRFSEDSEAEFLTYMLDTMERKMTGAKDMSEWRDRTPMGEQWVVLFDMTGWTRQNSDITTVKRLIKILNVHYPDRLGMAIIFNAPWIFGAVWAVITPFLEAVTRQKVRFIKARKDGLVLKELVEVIDPSVLECCFGGTHEKYPAPLHASSE